MKATVMSATASALRPGVHRTGIPSAVQAARSMFTAAPRQAAMTRKRGSLSERIGVDDVDFRDEDVVPLEGLDQVIPGQQPQGLSIAGVIHVAHLAQHAKNVRVEVGGREYAKRAGEAIPAWSVVERLLHHVL